MIRSKRASNITDCDSAKLRYHCVAFVLEEETPQVCNAGPMSMSGADARLRCAAMALTSSIALSQRWR
jgi:hypothetical protein